MQFIKQSEATASKRTVILYCVDGTGLIPYTGGAGKTTKILYPGAGTFTNSGTLTAVTTGTGHYYLALPTADIATLGPSRLLLPYASGTNLEAYADLLIIPFDPFEGSGLGLARLDALVSSRSSFSTAEVWTAGARTLTGTTGFGLAADQSGVTIGTLLTYLGTVGIVGTVLVYSGTVGTVGTLLTYLGTVGTVGTVLNVGDKTGYSLAANQGTVLIGTVGTLGAQAILQVNTEADTALSDIHLHKLFAISAGTALPGTVGAILYNMLVLSAGSFVYTTDALANAPGGGTGVTDWSAAERNQIRYRLGVDGGTASPTASHNFGTVTALVADKTGFSLAADQSGVTIGTLVLYTGTVGTVGTAKVIGEKTGFSLAADQSAVTVGTVNTVPAIGSVGTVGTLGAQAQADVWAYATRALTDKAGFSLAASQTGVTIGTVNQVGTVTTYLGTVGTVNVLGSLGAQAKADVNAEMVDVFGTDTIAELVAGTPSATPSLKNAVMLLYMDYRNAVTQTGTLRTVKNSGGTAIIQSTLSDDATTFTKTAYISA
mgnify:CR=1 FL=1